MDTKPALQNIQDAFLNIARRERSEVTLFLLSGARLSGRIKSFDKFSLILEYASQELLVFKHAISTISHTRGENGELLRDSEIGAGGDVRQAIQDSAPSAENSKDSAKQLDS